MKSDIQKPKKPVAIHQKNRGELASALHGMLKFFSFLATHGHQLPQIREPPKPWPVPGGPRQVGRNFVPLKHHTSNFRQQCDTVVLNCFKLFFSISKLFLRSLVGFSLAWMYQFLVPTSCSFLHKLVESKQVWSLHGCPRISCKHTRTHFHSLSAMTYHDISWRKNDARVSLIPLSDFFPRWVSLKMLG